MTAWDRPGYHRGVMGHAVHFLERLERANAIQADLALSLYRDPEAVAVVLGEARLPPEPDRVALSLDPRNQGPFLLVTREGNFVTCLAEGMSFDAPIIGHERLRTLMDRARKRRAAAELASELTGGGGVADLLQELIRAGYRVSRELIRAATAVQPSLRSVLLLETIRLFGDLRVALPSLSRQRRVNKRNRQLLKACWDASWTLGSFLPLYAMHGPSDTELLPSMVRDNLTPSWPLLQLDERVLGARAVWSVARLGKALLPAYKRRFLEAKTPVDLLEGLSGLLALGARHRRLRAEVTKTIRRMRQLDPRAFSFITEDFSLFAQVVSAAMEAPEETADLARKAARRETFEFAARLGLNTGLSWERPEDVPTDVAVSLMLSAPGPWSIDQLNYEHLLFVAPLVAQLDLPDLFLPQEWVDRFLPPARDIDHLAFAQRQRPKFHGKTVVRSEPKVGRNAPCPCGSGKNYKRCCGR